MGNATYFDIAQSAVMEVHTLHFILFIYMAMEIEYFNHFLTTYYLQVSYFDIIFYFTYLEKKNLILD